MHCVKIIMTLCICISHSGVHTRPSTEDVDPSVLESLEDRASDSDTPRSKLDKV